MSGKKKKYKKAPLPENALKFKTVCEKQIIESRLAANVAFSCEEEKYGDGYFEDEYPERTYYCSFSAKGYQARIYLADIDSIGAEFSWTNFATTFDFADVFDLFDIDDFNDYSYSDCVGESAIRDAVIKIISAFVCYSSYLKKAGEPDNLKKLNAQMREGENHKMPPVREFLKYSRLLDKAEKKQDKKSREKLVATLEKWEKNGSIPLHQKRYLKYLKSGAPITQLNSRPVKNNSTAKRYRCFNFLLIFGLILFGQGLCFAIFGLSRVIFLKDGLVIDSIGEYVSVIVSGAVISLLLIFVLGNKIARALAPKDLKEYVKYTRENEDYQVFKNKIERIIFYVAVISLCVVLVPAAMIGATKNISFYDDHFDSHMLFKNTTVKYSDCDVYELGGYYDDNGEYQKYDYPVYEFVFKSDTDKNSAETDQIRNADDLRQLQEILKNNNVKTAYKKASDIN